MTDDQYLKWKGAIAAARAAGDARKLASLQLDYNLELGECLSHQSRRTKDIQEELVSVKNNLGSVNTAVNLMDSRLRTLEAAVVRTADSVSILAKSVQDLVSYRDGLVQRHEGAKLAWRTIRSVVCGIAIVTGWAFAIYQFVVSIVGR